MPLTISPRTVAEPTNPYDKTLINLAISPIVMGAEIEAAMNMTCTPYRILDNGAIETNENLRVSFLSGAVFSEAQTDPALAIAAQAIWDAIQGYLTAKGV